MSPSDVAYAYPIINQLRALRQSKGLSQRQLSTSIGYSTEMVHAWETRQRLPTLRSLYEWCSGLGVELTIHERVKQRGY